MRQRGLEISQRVACLEAFLREHDEVVWAEDLEHAEAGGATGTEILFRLAGVLGQLLKSGDAKGLGIENEIKDLEREIGRQLKV